MPFVKNKGTEITGNTVVTGDYLLQIVEKNSNDEKSNKKNCFTCMSLDDTYSKQNVWS